MIKDHDVLIEQEKYKKPFIIIENYTLQVFIESIFVGIYCLILFSLLNYFHFDFYNLLFILGFSKHFLGYILGLHSLYCYNGASCRGMNHRDEIKCPGYERTFIKGGYKFLESILEGVVFLFLGFFLQKNGVKNKYIMIFFIGVFLHLVSDLIGLHTYFCMNCRNDKLLPEEIEEKIRWLNSV
jgi:hypothetical protein